MRFCHHCCGETTHSSLFSFYIFIKELIDFTLIDVLSVELDRASSDKLCAPAIQAGFVSHTSNSDRHFKRKGSLNVWLRVDFSLVWLLLFLLLWSVAEFFLSLLWVVLFRFQCEYILIAFSGACMLSMIRVLSASICTQCVCGMR